MICKHLNGPFMNPRTWNFRPVQTFSRVGGKKFKKSFVKFYIKNESKIGPFYLSCKMGMHVLLLKMGRVHFKQQKNKQGASWTAEKWAGRCSLLKMPRGNTTAYKQCSKWYSSYKYIKSLFLNFVLNSVFKCVKKWSLHSE